MTKQYMNNEIDKCVSQLSVNFEASSDLLNLLSEFEITNRGRFLALCIFRNKLIAKYPQQKNTIKKIVMAKLNENTISSFVFPAINWRLMAYTTVTLVIATLYM